MWFPSHMFSAAFVFYPSCPAAKRTGADLLFPSFFNVKAPVPQAAGPALSPMDLFREPSKKQCQQGRDDAADTDGKTAHRPLRPADLQRLGGTDAMGAGTDAKSRRHGVVGELR